MAQELKPWEEYDAAPAAPPVAQPGANIPAEAIPVGSEDYKALPPDANPAGFYDSEGGYNAFPEGVTVETAPNYMAVGDPAAITRTRPKRGVAESMWGGLQSSALFGLDDELQAAAGVAGNNIGNWLGMNESTMSNEDLYNLLLQQQREKKDQQWEDQPWAYGAGYVPGLFLGGGALARVAAPGAGAMRAGASTGAAEGLLQGYGNAEGNFMERSPEALLSAVLGAGGGAALGPLADMAITAGGRAVRRLNPFGGQENTGLRELAARAPQSGDEMAARAQEWRDAGVEPRLVDVVDESGRGVIRDAAGKMTPGREEVTRAADQQYIDAADRVSRQAQRHISDAPPAHRLAETVRAARNDAMEESMAPLRSAPVPVVGAVREAITTREGIAALRRAERLMKPEERGPITRVLKAYRDASRVDPSLPGPERQDIIDEIWSRAPLNVDIADKFARSLPDNVSPGLRRVAQDLADSVRGEARRLHPDYDTALTNYEGASRVADLAAGEGEQFLTSPASVYQDAVAPRQNSSAAQKTLENEAARAAARDEVINRAAAGSGAGAKGTAKQLARGSEEFGQRARNEALLGPEGARAMENTMEREFQRHANTEYIDPRGGSQTFGRGQDAIVDGFAEAAHAVANVKTAGVWGVAREASRWLRRAGIRDVDAARLSRDAISGDPNRVNAAIDYLAQKGMARERASRFVGAITGALSGATAGGNVPDQPHSVRSLYQHGGR